MSPTSPHILNVIAAEKLRKLIIIFLSKKLFLIHFLLKKKTQALYIP